MITRATKTYPNWSIVATTLRTTITATINDWSAISSHHGQFYEATLRAGLEINDRVGGGDSFASGLIYALLEDRDLQTAITTAPPTVRSP
jgi:2-dehydro-3-deoxygluconokinase